MSYIPDLVDHFPRTRRGHGRGLGRSVPPGLKHAHVRHMQNCQAVGCSVNGGKEEHEARDKNIEEWEAEHGIELTSILRSRRAA